MSQRSNAAVAGNDFHVDANHSNFIGSPVDLGSAHAGGFGGGVASVAGNDFHDIDFSNDIFIGSTLEIGVAHA
jgi:hypothetical protein